jgi:hypothetical protein
MGRIIARLAATSLLLPCFICLGGCTSELLGRYNSVQSYTQTENSHVIVSAFVKKSTPASTEGANKARVLQLSDEGQAALIKAMANSATKEDMIERLFESQKSNKAGDGGVIDRRSFKAFIVFSSRYNPWKPGLADRISSLEIVLSGLPNQLRFTNWDRIKTDYTTVTLGTQSLEKTAGLSANLSPTFSSFVVGNGSAGANISNKLNENVTLTEQHIILSGVLKDNELALMEEGVAGFDLIGNITCDVDFEFKPDNCDHLHVISFGHLWEDAEGRPLEPDKLKIDWKTLWVPRKDVVNKLSSELKNGTKDIGLYLAGTYQLRHVIPGKGDKTFNESDDDIEYFHGKILPAQNSVKLLRAEELSRLRTVYAITVAQNGGGVNHLTITNVSAAVKSAPARRMDFATFEEASDFINWLKLSTKKSSSRWTLLLGGKPLELKDVNNLEVTSENNL